MRLPDLAPTRPREGGGQAAEKSLRERNGQPFLFAAVSARSGGGFAAEDTPVA